MMTKIEIYTTSLCPYCSSARDLLERKGVEFKETDCTFDPDKRREAADRSGRSSVPQIWINGKHVGGCDDLYALDAAGKLDRAAERAGMSAAFTAACVQITAGREHAPNIDKACRLGRDARAQGADFIAFPENVTMIEPRGAEAFKKALPEIEHPGLAAFRALARETGAWILAGSLSIRAGERKYANRSFLIDSQGGVAARYDKIHLFNVDLAGGETYRESERIEPGSRAVTAALPWCTIGLTICYDVRFPQLYRALAQAGASVLTVPAAFTAQTGRAHWHVLNRARAIECGAFVIAAAQCGEHAEGRRTYGHSLIVDPWGEILADGGEGEGVVLARIDLAKCDEARRRIPALRHDRAFEAPLAARNAAE